LIYEKVYDKCKDTFFDLPMKAHGFCKYYWPFKLSSAICTNQFDKYDNPTAYLNFNGSFFSYRGSQKQVKRISPHLSTEDYVFNDRSK